MENACKGDEIMPLIPLKFPPGVFRNGTELDATGRWHDSNLCRWHDQTLKPIGGWRTRTEKAFDAPIRCLLYTSPSPRDGLLSRMPSSA